jgi:hypothetical protein
MTDLQEYEPEERNYIFKQLRNTIIFFLCIVIGLCLLCYGVSELLN